MKKRYTFAIMILLIVSAYIGLHFSKSVNGFETVEALECYDASTPDAGYYVNFEKRADQASFGSISFAGKQELANYTCRKGSYDGGDQQVRVSCFDANTRDDGYVVSFSEKPDTSVTEQIAEVNVTKISFSGVEKVTKLPCFGKK